MALRLAGLALIVITLGSSGCAAFRAQLGIGLGIGVTVKIPYVLHGGAQLSWAQMYIGHDYDEGWVEGRSVGGQDVKDSVDTFTLGPLHGVSSGKHEGWAESKYIGPSGSPHKGPVRSGMEQRHLCFGLVPGLYRSDDPDSYALEVEVQFLILSITLGFNPYYL